MTDINRRTLLQGSAIVAGLSAIGIQAKADVPAGRDPFDYEVQRTEQEWRDLLGDDYPVMREGKTEKQFSNPLWANSTPGDYYCKGCDLHQYTSALKINLTKGWLFFTASEPNSQLMSQDGRAVMAEDDDPFGVHIEVHCRRCASHIGHILLVEGRVLHCINGSSLNFVEAAA